MGPRFDTHIEYRQKRRLGPSTSAEKTFPHGFSSVLACRFTSPVTRYETAAAEQGLGTPMIAAKEGRLAHGLYKRYTPLNDAPGAAVTAWPTQLENRFSLFATVVTTQDVPAHSPVARAGQILQEAVSMGANQLWAEHRKKQTEYLDRPHARIWSADKSISLDMPWGGVPRNRRGKPSDGKRRPVEIRDAARTNLPHQAVKVQYCLRNGRYVQGTGAAFKEWTAQ